MNIRTNFIEKTRFLQPLFSLKSLASRCRVQLITPFYHSISDDYLPHISQLYSVKNTRQFKKDLDFLLRHFSPVDIDEFIQGNYSFSEGKPQFLLTFDDGLSELYQTVAPVLEEKGLSAIFFLNSSFIDNKALFHRYKASLIIDKIKSGQTDFKPTDKHTINKLLQFSYDQTNKIDEIASKVNLNFKQYLTTEQPYMTSREISNLIERGFYIGAHSMDHPLYSDLSLEKQLKQTRKSLKFIKSQFKIGYSLFAFPFSDDQVKQEFYTSLQDKEKGEVITFGTAGLKEDEISQHYQRLPMEQKNIPGSQVIKGEMMYIALRKVLGQHNTRRNDRI